VGTDTIFDDAWYEARAAEKEVATNALWTAMNEAE
jgi:hypothetical protein